MADLKLLLGVCGLYCGACYHYRASFPEGKHLLKEAVPQGWKVDGFTCQGCRSDSLYVHPGCAQCKIRACVQRAKALFTVVSAWSFPAIRFRLSRRMATLTIEMS